MRFPAATCPKLAVGSIASPPATPRAPDTIASAFTSPVAATSTTDGASNITTLTSPALPGPCIACPISSCFTAIRSLPVDTLWIPRTSCIISIFTSTPLAGIAPFLAVLTPKHANRPLFAPPAARNTSSTSTHRAITRANYHAFGTSAYLTTSGASTNSCTGTLTGFDSKASADVTACRAKPCALDTTECVTTLALGPAFTAFGPASFGPARFSPLADLYASSTFLASNLPSPICAARAIAADGISVANAVDPA